MENPGGFPTQKRIYGKPWRVSHRSLLLRTATRRKRRPHHRPRWRLTAPPLFFSYNTTTKHRKTTTKTPIKTRKTPHSGKKSPIFGTINRPNVKQAHEKRRAQEDPTRAAEARERRSPPDKISPLYQPAPPGARTKDLRLATLEPLRHKGKTRSARHLILLETIETFFTVKILTTKNFLEKICKISIVYK